MPFGINPSRFDVDTGVSRYNKTGGPPLRRNATRGLDPRPTEEVGAVRMILPARHTSRPVPRHVTCQSCRRRRAVHRVAGRRPYLCDGCAIVAAGGAR